MAKLRDRAALAVPLLIKLLKSGDVEFANNDPRARRLSPNTRGFTRETVILTLAAIGPPAKDALPILEVELAALNKKEQEDALLSGSGGSRSPAAIGSTPASLLRLAINAIKGESPPAEFRRRN